MTTNRLGWTAAQAYEGGHWNVVNRSGHLAWHAGRYLTNYPTQAEAEAAIVAVIAKRDRKNAQSRVRHEVFTSLGMARCRDGRYE